MKTTAREFWKDIQFTQVKILALKNIYKHQPPFRFPILLPTQNCSQQIYQDMQAPDAAWTRRRELRWSRRHSRDRKSWSVHRPDRRTCRIRSSPALRRIWASEQSQNQTPDCVAWTGWSRKEASGNCRRRSYPIACLSQNTHLHNCANP